jgi:hypothetical protein
VSSGTSDFVVVWGTSSYGVAGRRVDGTGTPLGAEFLVTPAGAGPRPDVAMDPAGTFTVVWGDYSPIFARRYDAAGNALGAPFQVSTFDDGYNYQHAPTVAADGNGNFVVVWYSGPSSSSDPAQDGDGDGVFGRRFDATGAPLGGEFQVNTETAYDQAYPDVAAAPGGDFVVTWLDEGDCYACVDARLFDAAGAPLGGSIRLLGPGDDTNGHDERAPQLRAAADATGSFVVTWGDILAIDGRRIDPDGTLGPRFQVSPLRGTYQYTPAVAAAPGGDFVVVWNWYIGSEMDAVFGRRMVTCPPAPRSCRAPVIAGKSRLVLKDRTPDGGDGITWKWVRGAATDLADLGDPFAAHDYSLCLYDATGQLLQATVPPGGTCDAKPCWASLDDAAGFKYVDKPGTRDGIQRLVLRWGAAGEARVIAKGKGERLPLPALPLTPPVDVQLHATSGECWGTRYEAAGVTLNTTADFKATGPP